MSRPRRAERNALQPIGSDPEESVARAVVAVLNRSQRRTVFGDSDSPAADYLAERLEAAREAQHGRLPPGLAAERTEATQIAEGIEWAMSPLVRIFGFAFVITGWIWLGSGLLAIGLAFLTGGAPASDSESWSFSGISSVPFAICVVAFPLAGIALVLRNSLQGLRKRRQRAALIRWAVQRPGQLARGLPGWPVSGDYGEVQPPAASWLNILKWIFFVVAVFFAPLGVVVLLVGVFAQETISLQIGGILLLLAAITGGLAWLLQRWIERIIRYDEMADVGLRWVWEGKLPQDAYEADQPTS